MERYLRENLLGPGPRLLEKRIYRAAVSKRLRNTGWDDVCVCVCVCVRARACVCVCVKQATESLTVSTDNSSLSNRTHLRPEHWLTATRIVFLLANVDRHFQPNILERSFLFFCVCVCVYCVWEKISCECFLGILPFSCIIFGLQARLCQWRTQEFRSGGWFNKLSWGQRTERTRTWGAAAPQSGVLEAAVIWYKKFHFT